MAEIANRQADIASQRHEAQTKADQQRRITESYSKAVVQLASEKIAERLGGIYTLERVSRESPDDYWTEMETLMAFVREQARWKESVAAPPPINLPPPIDVAPPTDIALPTDIAPRRILLLCWQ